MGNVPARQVSAGSGMEQQCWFISGLSVLCLCHTLQQHRTVVGRTPLYRSKTGCVGCQFETTHLDPGTEIAALDAARPRHSLYRRHNTVSGTIPNVCCLRVDLDRHMTADTGG